MLRIALAVTATMLASSCASSAVGLRAPKASFNEAQRVLGSVANDYGLNAMFVAAKYPSSGSLRPRTAMEVFMPSEKEHGHVHAHSAPLVYSLEVSDFDNRISFWIADPRYAAPLCRALRVAGVPFEVIEGGDVAPGCAGR